MTTCVYIYICLVLFEIAQLLTPHVLDCAYAVAMPRSSRACGSFVALAVLVTLPVIMFDCAWCHQLTRALSSSGNELLLRVT